MKNVYSTVKQVNGRFIRHKPIYKEPISVMPTGKLVESNLKIRKDGIKGSSKKSKPQNIIEDWKHENKKPSKNTSKQSKSYLKQIER